MIESCAKPVPATLFLIVLYLWFLSLLSGQVPKIEQSNRNAQATTIEHPPNLDGTLDDPLWQSAIPITDFRQREPYEGEPPTEKTEVRILYTRHAVYFGIHCYDSQPSRIIATELRRDVSQELDDHFEILIDSNINHRSSYVFEVNRPGTQNHVTIRAAQRDNKCR